MWLGLMQKLQEISCPIRTDIEPATLSGSSHLLQTCHVSVNGQRPVNVPASLLRLVLGMKPGLVSWIGAVTNFPLVFDMQDCGT